MTLEVLKGFLTMSPPLFKKVTQPFKPATIEKVTNLSNLQPSKRLTNKTSINLKGA